MYIHPNDWPTDIYAGRTPTLAMQQSDKRFLVGFIVRLNGVPTVHFFAMPAPTYSA